MGLEKDKVRMSIEKSKKRGNVFLYFLRFASSDCFVSRKISDGSSDLWLVEKIDHINYGEALRTGKVLRLPQNSVVQFEYLASQDFLELKLEKKCILVTKTLMLENRNKV